MGVSPLREIANELRFLKAVDDREKLLGVVGALVLRKISLAKASEIMGMERERFLGLLDAMNLEYSSPWIFLAKIGVIDSALNLFHPVYVPSSVTKEVLCKKDESAALLQEIQEKNRLLYWSRDAVVLLLHWATDWAGERPRQ